MVGLKWREPANFGIWGQYYVYFKPSWRKPLSNGKSRGNAASLLSTSLFVPFADGPLWTSISIACVSYVSVPSTKSFFFFFVPLCQVLNDMSSYHQVICAFTVFSLIGFLLHLVACLTTKVPASGQHRFLARIFGQFRRESPNNWPTLLFVCLLLLRLLISSAMELQTTNMVPFSDKSEKFWKHSPVNFTSIWMY